MSENFGKELCKTFGRRVVVFVEGNVYLGVVKLYGMKGPIELYNLKHLNTNRYDQFEGIDGPYRETARPLMYFSARRDDSSS